MVKRIIINLLCIFILLLNGCVRTNDINTSTAITEKPQESVASNNGDVETSPIPDVPVSSLTPEDATHKNSLYSKVICIDPGHGNPDKATGDEQFAPDSDKMQFGGAYGTTGMALLVSLLRFQSMY